MRRPTTTTATTTTTYYDLRTLANITTTYHLPRTADCLVTRRAGELATYMTTTTAYYLRRTADLLPTTEQLLPPLPPPVRLRPSTYYVATTDYNPVRTTHELLCRCCLRLTTTYSSTLTLSYELRRYTTYYCQLRLAATALCAATRS